MFNEKQRCNVAKILKITILIYFYVRQKGTKVVGLLTL
jgi:hypothetical protein